MPDNRKRSRSTDDKNNKKLVVDRATQKYARGNKVDYKVGKNVKHKNLRRTLEETHDRNIDAASRTAATEVLLTNQTGFIETEHEGERTYKLKQSHLKPMLDLNTQRSCIDLSLTAFGPYSTSFSKNGRTMLFCGEKGHVASMDFQRMKVGMEMQLEESVYDVKFLHNETLFAAAQNKYTYIYDSSGVEIHCLKGHERPYKLDFLPYHFLLTTVGHSGWIKWHDVSTGTAIAGYQTGHGPVRVQEHNPTTAVSHVGHSNGVVSMWSPASGKPLVSMFCHKAPVSDLSIDLSGNYMSTAGLDGIVKIWDLRTYKTLHKFTTDQPVLSLDTSETGLIAMGMGRSAQVLKDAFLRPTENTYIKHTVRALGSKATNAGGGSAVTARVRGLASSIAVKSVRFRPLQDFLCISHSHGVSTIVVPGAGEANYDSYEANPFSNNKQSREGEIQGLMNKLSPDMIGLANKDGGVGSLDRDQNQLRSEHHAIFNSANDGDSKKKKDKHKMRGKNKISAKLRRKQKNVIDAANVKMREKLDQEREEREKTRQGADQKKLAAKDKNGGLSALKRFNQKK